MMILATRDCKVGRGLGVHRTKGKLLVQSLDLAGICEEDRLREAGNTQSRSIVAVEL